MPTDIQETKKSLGSIQKKKSKHTEHKETILQGPEQKNTEIISEKDKLA